jgi:hypothetical protein
MLQCESGSEPQCLFPPFERAQEASAVWPRSPVGGLADDARKLRRGGQMRRSRRSVRHHPVA